MSKPGTVISNEDHERIAATFLGPKGENINNLNEYLQIIVGKLAEDRKQWYPDDGNSISATTISSTAYRERKTLIGSKLIELLTGLGISSPPFFSPRYIAHMVAEPTLPSVLGYFAGMMYNPNNVTFEASPFTSMLEVEVGKDLCRMLGYHEDNPNTTPDDLVITPVGWGHLTCGGSIANLEALWAARNLKYYPLSLRDALENSSDPAFIKAREGLNVKTCDGTTKLFMSLTLWELLNLEALTILNLPYYLQADYYIPEQVISDAVTPYSVQTIGINAILKKWKLDQEPVFIASITRHYSFPKGAAILGIGSHNLIDIPIDVEGRLDIKILTDRLTTFSKEKRAVYLVTGVIGTTEEGAIDPLVDMVDLRQKLREQGLNFSIHGDAAWGGYFCTMLPKERRVYTDFVPNVPLSENSCKQLRALRLCDSVTLDPHKTGYVPYAAGAICYKDGRMKYLNTWSAPYLGEGGVDYNVGVYGVEGSRPGAAAAAVYMAHQVIELNPKGYGKLMGEAIFTSHVCSAWWATLSKDKSSTSTEVTKFIVVPFDSLPVEKNNPDVTSIEIEDQKEIIRKTIIGRSNLEIVQDQAALELLGQLGSDTNINVFACNFRLPDGSVNREVQHANELNKRLWQRFSVNNFDPTSPERFKSPLFLSSTVFTHDQYGECAQFYKKRLGLDNTGTEDLFVLRNTIMSPFVTVGDLLQNIMAEFKSAIEEEIQKLLGEINGNLFEPVEFIVHGIPDDMSLVFLPNASSPARAIEFITRCKLADRSRSLYIEGIKRYPDSLVRFKTSKIQNLKDIQNGSSVDGDIVFLSAQGGEVYPMVVPATFNDINVVKHRPLSNIKPDKFEPPKDAYFFLWGAPERVNIEYINPPGAKHRLQLSAGNISSSIPVAKDILAKGVYCCVEGAFSQNPYFDFDIFARFIRLGKFFFGATKKLDVVLYRDETQVLSREPADAVYKEIKRGALKKLGSGTIELPRTVYIDYLRINETGVVHVIKRAAKLLKPSSPELVGEAIDARRPILPTKTMGDHKLFG